MIYSSYEHFAKDLNEMLSQSYAPRKPYKMTPAQQRIWQQDAQKFFGLAQNTILNHQQQKTK